jgi:hypothetical protein
MYKISGLLQNWKILCPQEKRAVGDHCGENQESCTGNALDARFSLGGSLKNFQADVKVDEGGAPEDHFVHQNDPSCWWRAVDLALI